MTRSIEKQREFVKRKRAVRSMLVGSKKGQGEEGAILGKALFKLRGWKGKEWKKVPKCPRRLRPFLITEGSRKGKLNISKMAVAVSKTKTNRQLRKLRKPIQKTAQKEKKRALNPDGFLLRTAKGGLRRTPGLYPFLRKRGFLKTKEEEELEERKNKIIIMLIGTGEKEGVEGANIEGGLFKLREWRGEEWEDVPKCPPLLQEILGTEGERQGQLNVMDIVSAVKKLNTRNELGKMLNAIKDASQKAEKMKEVQTQEQQVAKLKIRAEEKIEEAKHLFEDMHSLTAERWVREQMKNLLEDWDRMEGIKDPDEFNQAKESAIDRLKIVSSGLVQIKNEVDDLKERAKDGDRKYTIPTTYERVIKLLEEEKHIEPRETYKRVLRAAFPGTFISEPRVKKRHTSVEKDEAKRHRRERIFAAKKFKNLLAIADEIGEREWLDAFVGDKKKDLAVVSTAERVLNCMERANNINAREWLDRIFKKGINTKRLDKVEELLTNMEYALKLLLEKAEAGEFDVSLQDLETALKDVTPLKLRRIARNLLGEDLV